MIINWLSSLHNNIVTEGYGVYRIYSGGQSPMQFTPDFIAAASADFRCPKALVEVTWANSEVDQNAVLASNDINRIDRKGQLFNGRTTSGSLWAYLHSGLKPNGTFSPAPALDSDRQLGWYGSDLVGDGSGDFSTEPYMEVTHDARSYSAVLIAGDSKYDEYPVDFTLTFTHPGGPTTINVVGNTERIYSSEIPFVNDVTVFRLSISKWSAPNTIVKITQLAGALIELYRADDIISLDILEETNSDTGVVPIGNVSANELDLSLLNTDRRFSQGNTDSPYNTSLRSRRKIRVWLGFVLPAGSSDVSGDVAGYIVETVGSTKIGYMPYGVFWSKDWLSSYESMATNTTAYDVTYLLSQKKFYKSLNYTGTIQDIVDAILNEALSDVPDLTWTVSSDTAGIVWTNVSFEPKSYLEILKDIAEASSSYSYVDRDGTLVIGSYLDTAPPAEAWKKIDLSVYYNYQSEPKLDELINRIRVGYTKYKLALLADIYTDEEIFTIPAGGVLTFYIGWSKTPVLVSSVGVTLTVVSGAPLLTNSEIYAYGGFLTVTGLAGASFQISATGESYELEENTETTSEDEESLALYGAREFSLSGNALVTDVTQAQALADNLLARYSNVRQDGSITLPASTLVSVGDVIEVTEFKSDTIDAKADFVIKRQSINYDGSMQGQIDLRRG